MSGRRCGDRWALGERCRRGAGERVTAPAAQREMATCLKPSENHDISYTHSRNTVSIPVDTKVDEGFDTMSSARLDLALQLTKPSDWERFENLASRFLASEFTGLRTVSWPSGDKGRDARLWSPTDDNSIAIQYSVAADWKSKIRSTVVTLRREFGESGVSVLFYMTNQVLPPADVDDLRSELRTKYRVHLEGMSQ